MNQLIETLRSVYPVDALLLNEPMARYTTFRVGGPADVLALPDNAAQILCALNSAEEAGVPAYVIGNGSNLLVLDGGIRGLVVALGDRFAALGGADTLLTAQAGALLSKVSAEALSRGLSGLEFASGIPGTVGGAVTMNAGAYGGQISDCLEYADLLMEGEVRRLSREELHLGYRQSLVLERGGVVLEAGFRLQPGKREQIRATMDRLNAQRREKQPLNYPSAGSTFKRPEGHFAGALIEQAGLKGLSVGGARVSEKHAGFIINADNASAQDILQLIEQVKRAVRAHSGVDLECEVRILGEP